MVERVSCFGVRGVRHYFGGVAALRGVDFELRAGKVHGLVGENGAGKSTLIRVLTGALAAMEGEIYLGNEAVSLPSPAHAQRLGIGVVHQDVHLFPELNVATNVYAANNPLPRRLGRIDWSKVRTRVQAQLDTLGIDIPVDKKVSTLDLAERKLIEIAKAMMRNPRFLILDEPTASLERRAAGRVLQLLERLRAEGIGVCFISHRLDEVSRIADEVTVLRDGQVVGRLGAHPDEEQMVAHILGTKLLKEETQGHQSFARDRIAVKVAGFRLPGSGGPVNLDIREGEIFGLTGLLGSGAERIVRMLGGAIPCTGEVWVHGKKATIKSVPHAIHAGIGFVPEDRKRAGLVLDQSVAVNVSLASLANVTAFGLLRHGKIRQRAEDFRQRLSIKTASVSAPVRTLSGGNQQKVVLSKWLATNIRILCVEEPSHGVDVGAKAQIHDLLRHFVEQGGTVIVAATEVGELLNLCDRIAVFRHGEVVATLGTHESEHADVVLAGMRDPENVIDSLMESGVAG